MDSSYQFVHINDSFLLFPDILQAAPHSVAADDVYNGYFLPKGSLILGNTWYAILQLIWAQLKPSL